MTKLKGNVRIVYTAPTEKTKPVFEIRFVPYAGRLNAPARQIQDEPDLVDLLLLLGLTDDDASRWVGKVKVEGLVLIPEVQSTEQKLKEGGLVV